MGRLRIFTKSSADEDYSLKLPGELIYYLLNKRGVDGKNNYRVSVVKLNRIENQYQYVLTISNFWSDPRGERPRYNRGLVSGIRRSSLKFQDTFDIAWTYMGKSYTKPNGRLGMCESYEADYSILEEGDIFTIISYFNIGEVIKLPSSHPDGFKNTVNELVADRLSHSYVRMQIEKHSDEFFHFIKFEVDTFTYVTRDKFYDVLLNGGYSNRTVNLDLENSLSIFGNHVRTISISKFMLRIFPNHDAKQIQQYIEYNKMLSSYDPSMFSIVTGSDISKYYDVNNYFTNTGDLGSSCMRHDIKQHVVKFYDNNKNVSLIIVRPNGVDAIIGRALLWTTTDGTKVMDRIYTSNSKLVSLFHRYAAENGFINIYEVRKHPNQRELTAMSPGNWLPDYDRNYVVDIDYLPEKLLKADNATKFYRAFRSRSVSMSDPADMPYIDNFNLINANSMQLSLLPIADTFKCPVSDTYVNCDNYLDFNGQIYNDDLVSIKGNNPVLMSDTVELDSFPVPTDDEEVAYVDSEEFEGDYSDEESEAVTVREEPEIVIPVGHELLHQINNEARLVTYVNQRATPQAILDYFNIQRGFVMAGGDATDLDFSSNR
jgi:hypothetical protein